MYKTELLMSQLLNSNRELAAWWATGSRDNKDEMMKWVLEPSQIGSFIPFPILKTPGKYPSVVNIDADHAEAFSADAATKKTQYNQGRKFGTLTINIQNASGGNGSNAPSGANITTNSVTPNITDKDPAHFNFNYYKVQLPYYNDVGTKNYTDNKVVTGWKIDTVSLLARMLLQQQTKKEILRLLPLTTLLTARVPKKTCLVLAVACSAKVLTSTYLKEYHPSPLSRIGVSAFICLTNTLM